MYALWLAISGQNPTFMSYPCVQVVVSKWWYVSRKYDEYECFDECATKISNNTNYVDEFWIGTWRKFS